MKKKMFFAVLLTGLLFASCKEACYECTLTNLGTTTNYDVCEGQACSNGTCNDLGMTSNKEYVESLEQAGYSCTKK